MVRRVVHDAPDTVAESHVVETRPSVVTTIANVLTVLYAVIVAVIGLDALFEALDAREQNGFVSAIDRIADVFVAPFDGMFADQRYWATALIAVVVYTIVYVIAVAALRRDRTVM